MPPLHDKRHLAANGEMRWMTYGAGGGADGNTRPEQAHLPQSVAGLSGEASVLETIAAQAGELTSLGDRPLVVLTAGSIADIPPEVPREVVERMQREIWPAMQREAAALSTQGEYRLVEDAGHYIHYERPDVVVEAVLDVVSAVRAGG